MKKISKLLMLLLSLVLVCGVFAVIVSASGEEVSDGARSGYKYEIVNPETAPVYANTFTEALGVATADAVITLLADDEVSTTASASVNIKKNLTVDLGGHTMYLTNGGVQKGLTPSSSVKVTFKNGNIVSSANSNYSDAYNSNKSHAIFTGIGTNAIIQLENVNTYGYAVAYSNANAYTISVKGGEHYVYTDYANLTSGGWICGNNNITAMVEDAEIYLTHSNAYLIGFQNYKTTAALAKSVATFNNCKIITYSADKNIISSLNKYTRVAFTNCDIYGKIAPGNTKYDTPSNQSTFSSGDNKPVDGSVVLGVGCRVSSKVVSTTVVRWADNVTPADLTALDKTVAVELNVNKPSGYYAKGTFAISAATMNATYTWCDAELLNEKVEESTPVGDVYKVVSGSTTKYYDASANIADIISAASAGSTIYLLQDITITSDRYLNSNNEYVATSTKITKELTFDLGGNTLTYSQRAKNCGFYLATTSLVTFKNGNIKTVAHSDYNSSGLTFSFVNGSSNNASIKFENINFSGSSLIYSYGTSYNLTIEGGTFSMDNGTTDMNTAGLISGQSNINATVTGATIYTKSRAIVGASSYRVSTGLTPDTQIKFVDCDIIASSATTNLMGNANQHTHVYFTNCRVFGSITPSINAQDKKFTVATPENFVIDEKTLFSSSSNLLANTTLAKGITVNKVSEYITVGATSCIYDRQADYIYAIWYDENGNVLKSQKITSDLTSLVAPTYEGKSAVSNGWYNVGGYVANAWSDTASGKVAVDFSKIDPSTITSNISFYPLLDDTKITAGITVAMYNLSTTGSIRNNFYLPKTPDNVEIIGVYVGTRAVNGRLVLFYNYKDDPVYYNMYQINEVGATEFTKSTVVTVKYKVNGTVELEQSFTLSPENYANIIYADSQKTSGNSYGEKAYNVTADLVRYSYLLSLYANKENENLTALYNKMSSLCSSLPADNDLAGSITNVSALAGAGSIAYEASSYEPRWKFTLNSSAQVVDIKITLDGYTYGANADRTNFGTCTYAIESITRDDSGYITSAYSQNIPLYNIVRTFTITLVKEDGSEISGTYDLKSYYTAVAKNTAAADFVKAIFALADSTVAYKFPNGKITVNDICDFWDCDHAGAEKQETIVSDIYNFAPRYCSKCDSWLFYYEDYGAVADGKTDRTRLTHVSGTNDYEAIYWTHKNANEWKARTDLSDGKHVAVVGNSNPGVAKYYYISLPEGRGIYSADIDNDGIPETDYKGKNLGTIVIATDTSWNGVNLIIDDDAICNAKNCNCVNAVGIMRKHNYTSQAIFTVDEYGKENYTENLVGKITSLDAGATNIGYAPGRKMLISLTDSNKKIYFRYGSNASNGAAITEVILVDEFGNIDPSTPVQFDYATVTSATGYAVDTDPIKISGLNGEEINASFESYVNNALTISIPHYTSCGRNITIKRSNATVEGIERFFTEEPANSNLTNKRFAYTFIVTTLCSHPTVKDMIVINHNSQSGESGVSQGSYEFSGNNANAVSWINCRTKNMFSAGKDGSLQAYPIYRGLFGTNHIRNMYLKDCYLNSFDAHTGAYNVTIEDSTVEHMNFIGGGDIKIKNVIVYTSSQGMAFNLRTDYGSTWHGDVYIDGLTIRYAAEGSSKPSRITIFKGSYENQYWGFDTYAPQNVTINNFHVQAYTATVSGGVRTETLGAIDDPNMNVYYYYAIRNLKESDVPTESKAGIHGPTDKGDPTITYDYGTNRLVCTQSITITNSGNIILPTGSYWKNMDVTIDGVTKKWTGDSSSGTWN